MSRISGHPARTLGDVALTYRGRPGLCVLTEPRDLSAWWFFLTSDYSFGYVATWAGGGEQAIAGIKGSCERIQKSASAILRAFEPAAEQEGGGVGRLPPPLGVR